MNLLISSFLALFFTIDVIGLVPIFVSLTSSFTVEHRKELARRGVIVATGILFFFAFSGSAVLDALNISLAAFRIAGGVLLLILSVDMVLAKPDFDLNKEDISIFPVATPLLSGPAAITMLILFMKQAEGSTPKQIIIMTALVANMFICWLVLHFAVSISKYLGRTGINVLNRIFGILLTALACQFFIDGISEAFFK